ncbi:MAG: leucine-rich repeat protein [Candidatus Methanomethylophilaceae archaeon]|nr:leucine-rich repeat protein [Candidatus Methanomethylophilaceae archaeon]
MSLKSIDIPGSIVSIGGGAFSDCISAESVSIPAGLESIGGSAFFGLEFLDKDDKPVELVPDRISGCSFQGVDGVLRLI